MADLDAFVAKARAVKTAALKEAAGPTSSALDSAEDGTKPAATGAQAAANKSDAGDYTAAMADGGAKTNPVGGSVANSTDNATAVSTSGQEGAKGADLEVVKDADNGKEQSQNKVDGKGDATGSFKAAADLKAFADELRKAASALLTPLDHFLVKAARAIEEPELKKVAQEMSEDDLAGNASDALMEQIQSGQLSDDDAAAILEEALQSGAISEEDIAQAAQMLEGQGGEGAPEGAEGMDGGAGLPPEAAAGMDAAAATEVPPSPEVDPATAPEAKMAAAGNTTVEAMKLASVTPDSPKYVEKLVQIFPTDIQAGYDFGIKLAEELLKEAKEEDKEEEKEEKEEGHSEPDGDEGMPVPGTPEEKAAAEAVQQELGLPPEAVAQLAAQPLPKVASFKQQYKLALLSRIAGLPN